jgi:pyruvate,water dikinase
MTVLVKGAPASAGVGAGSVIVIHDVREIGSVKEGDVLVVPMTTPDFVPAMKKAAALVTDRGGRTCHAAIVSRELGLPCIVGTGNATKILKSGQEVTVNAGEGKVYEGIIAGMNGDKTVPTESVYKKTKTKLLVNLADPSLAAKVAAMNVDGVGLLRAEFIIAHHVKEHPHHMLDHGRGAEFTAKLADGIRTFAKAFHPRPVVYRTSDFKTNEYRNLIGGAAYEEMEENPMIGFRGAFRHLADAAVFKLETDALQMVTEEYDNVRIMIPFVRTPDELKKVKAVLEAEKIKGQKLWIMVEVPSTVIILDKFLDVGVDGVSIGSNDLTQLILGIDRDSEKLAATFDERNPAVLSALESVITTCRKRNVTVSICGQAPSFYPDLTAKLVEWGITSVSVSPDMIAQTRDIIGGIEKKKGILPPQ